MWGNDGTIVRRFKARDEPKEYRQIFKYYMFCITEWTQQSKPDTVADNHKENINLLFYDNYRGDEALAMSNENNKGWTNFSRVTIVPIIHEFTKWKFYQITWLWLFGFYYSKQQKYTRLISSKSPARTVKKQKSPHCYANLRGTLNHY